MIDLCDLQVRRYRSLSTDREWAGDPAWRKVAVMRVIRAAAWACRPCGHYCAVMPTFDAAGAMLSAWELLAAEVPDGWSWRGRDLIGLVTGLATPTMNGVWATSVRVNVDEVRAALDSIIDAGVPYCLQFPESHRGLGELAVELGMEREADVPLMWLFGEPVARDIAGLSVRRVSADELTTHVDLAARGFGAPHEIFRSLATMTARTPGLGTYVGEYDGEPVTTAVALCTDDSVGVFTVATPVEHRGHGFGTAITAHAIRDGYRLGAERAWLQSSLEGYSVYEAMGFATVASWQCWIAYPTPSSE